MLKFTKRTTAALAMITFLSLGGMVKMNAATPPKRSPVAAAPPLGAGTWINGTPTPLSAYKGKVVVLAFWTHQCINCKHTLPFWNGWAGKYGSDVVVTSVHTPELPSERDIANVRAAVQQEGVRFPVVTDNDFTTWKRFKVEAWPTTILLDKQGREVGRWVGELDYNKAGTYRQVEAAIERARKEK